MGVSVRLAGEAMNWRVALEWLGFWVTVASAVAVGAWLARYLP